jgi:hypothetical protein
LRSLGAVTLSPFRPTATSELPPLLIVPLSL